MVYARGVFSLLVLVAIVMGTLVVIDAPTVLAGGVTPAQNCKKNCQPYYIEEVFPGPFYIVCVYRTCDARQCYYDCTVIVFP